MRHRSYLRNNRKSFGTLHTLPEPPPAVDGGAGSDGESLPAVYNGMSNNNSFQYQSLQTMVLLGH